jgi:TRAP-type C4-dicarboxylate transport system permease small subunit
MDKDLDLKILKGTTTCLFFALIIVTFAQVLLRYVFKSTIRGGLELAQFLYVCITFLGAPIIQKKREHISIDFLKDRLPYKAKMILEIFIQIANGLFLILPIYGGYLMFCLTTKSYLPTLPITFSYFYGVLVFGLSAMLFYTIRQIYLDLRSFSERSKNYE